jgi:hypothetical protein
MVQELLSLLPKEVGTLALVLAMAGTLAGAGLWLAGARFSRSLITLVLVSAGGWIGLFLPQWMGWSIDGWAPAILLAIVLGASGFVLHRFWVGVGLGLVLAGWAAVIVWMICKGNAVWTLPKYRMGTTATGYAKDLWQSLPADVVKFLPFAAGMALVSGLAGALVWPRIGVVVLYSVVGVSMVVGLGLCVMSFERPQWIGMLPAKGSLQVMLVMAMVAFGALLQWQIAPVKKGKQKQGRPIVVLD